MTTPYATVTDLAAYLGSEPPAGAQRLLARASDLLDAEMLKAVFSTDSSGNITDPVVTAALNAACLRQVEYWIANGDELNELGNWTSYSVAGVTVTRDAQTSIAARRRRLCARALDVLRNTMTTVQFYPVPLSPGKPVS